MSRIKIYGPQLDVGSRGSRKVVSMPTTKAAGGPIVQDLWARNRNHPNVTMVNSLNEAANQAVLFRTKEVFRGGGLMTRSGISRLYGSGAGDAALCRFAFHTGPYTHSLLGVAVMYAPNAGENQNSSATLNLYTSASLTPVVATTSFTYGVNPSGTTGVLPGWNALKPIIKGLAVDPDTTYYATLYNTNYGRVQSASFFECASATENLDGYLPQNLTTHSPILDVYRENLATITRALWRRSGATILNYTSWGDSGFGDTAPATIAGTTVTNLVDRTTTGAPAASSPGFTLDMTGKRRLSQTTGVPFTFAVCAKVSTAGSAAGVVKLVDSSNNTISSISGGWTTSASWQSVTTGLLPASAAKYDLQYSGNVTNTFTVYAVSMYEYEA